MGTQILYFCTIICPYELIFHAKKERQIGFEKQKKNPFDLIEFEKSRVKIIALKIELTAGVKKFKLKFGQTHAHIANKKTIQTQSFL